MPFICKAVIEPSQLRAGSIIFDGWIENSWDRFVPKGTAFATGHDAEGPCQLILNGPGFLSTKPDLAVGDRITEGSVVAYFAADGESIPYGKPYCLVEYALGPAS